MRRSPGGKKHDLAKPESKAKNLGHDEMSHVDRVE
jgi:hypothetical protein